MKATKSNKMVVGQWFSFRYLKPDAEKPESYKILVDVISAPGREHIFSGRREDGAIRHFRLDRVVAETRQEKTSMKSILIYVDRPWGRSYLTKDCYGSADRAEAAEHWECQFQHIVSELGLENAKMEYVN